jgi:hypothetical protein
MLIDLLYSIIDTMICCSVDDHFDPITLVGGPIDKKERQALLNEINQFVPLRKVIRQVHHDKENSPKPKAAARPTGTKNKIVAKDKPQQQTKAKTKR